MVRLIAVILFACCFFSCKQKNDLIFTFTQIGWTLELPRGFVLLDSSVVKTNRERAKEMIQSSTGKKLNDNQKKIIFAAKNKENYFSSSLTPFYESKDTSWQDHNQKTKNIIFETAKNQIPNGLFDSLNTVEIIDSIRFNKFTVIGKIDNNIIFNFTMLSKLYKGYNFEINYVVKDENIGFEIETMLKNSRFSR